MPELIVLRGGGASMVLATDGDRLPAPLHWGADLGDLAGVEDALVAAVAPSVTNSGPDVPVPVALLPQASEGYAGRGGLQGSREGRDWSPRFVRTGLDATGGSLVVEAVDEGAGLALRSELVLDEHGVLAVRHRLSNTGTAPYEVASLPVRLPVPSRATELLDLTGRWARERVPQRHDLAYGAWVREGRRGRTGHDAPVLTVLGTPGFGFRHGEVWGLHVAWSGDTSVWAERLPEGTTGLGGGELLAAGEVRLEPGASYTPPWVYAVHSLDGLDGLSRSLHRLVRARPGHPMTPRPVVLNTWEAVYFDHDLERLTELAEIAAEVGVERFVLDDGWFGDRRDDRAGLGDWTVSPDAWPDGLTTLVERVTGLGMDFGLWVEPEMVNLDSDLARAHPDWLLSLPRRVPPAWRHQHVLDLGRPEAWQHLLERLDALLSEHEIAFLKWDHNRDLVDAHHDGRPGVRSQTLAFYALLDELRGRHPRVEIESCASGGGRVDLAVLERTDRIWTSDCTDALERQAIQRWTGLLVPPELLGAHVSAPRNHQTGRVLDLGLRAGTAMFGHFGIEWDLTAASPADLRELTGWVTAYRELRGLLHSGDVVHADDLPDGLELHGVVSADRSHAVFAVVQVTPLVTSVPPACPLPGLDPARRYRVRARPPGDAPRTMELVAPPWLQGDLVLPGAVLERLGVAVPVLAPAQVLLLELEATD